ncbi:MAG: hypothetical protein IJA87_03205 [Clostridia bacterium]|nr:hypothetical protein [Clostridia bacterium]
MKNIVKYYFIIVFIIILAVFSTCGVLTVQEKGAYTVFGEEAETIQLSTDIFSAELRKLF